MRTQLYFCALALFVGSSALAAPRVSLFGIADQTDLVPSDSSGAAATSNIEKKFGFGGGLGLSFPLSMRAALEVDGIYLGRKFSTTGSTVDTSLTYLQIPVLARLHLSRFLSLGVGGYYATALGDVKSSTGETATYESIGYSKTDYGLVGALGLNAPLGHATSLFAEGRYAFGLKDVDLDTTDTHRLKWRDIQVLVGLRFGMGKH
jgi:hypothetical protein